MSVAVVIAVVALVGVATSGCDSTATGTPTPETPGSSNTSSTEEDRLAPPVENPKDLRGIDPCQLLTQAQLTELTITEPGMEDTSRWGEKKCTFQNAILSVGFAPDTTLGEGLDQAYRSRDNFDNFEESSVGEYPAVRTNFATQVCSVVVGVADDQALTVHHGRFSTKAPGPNDPCEFAEQVAGMVLDNLPAA